MIIIENMNNYHELKKRNFWQNDDDCTLVIVITLDIHMSII